MRIVCISDTHGNFPSNLPKGDMLIHAGDFTLHGTKDEADRFMRWFDALDYKHKIAIPGNHDACIEDGYRPETEGAHLLIHQTLELDGYTIFGSPITPLFNDWHFMASLGAREILWRDIPKDVDILITHGPPRGILDKNYAGMPCGDIYLRGIKSPDLHVFGHIHEEGGQVEYHVDRYCVNASLMDGNFQMTRKPVVIDL